MYVLFAAALILAIYFFQYKIYQRKWADNLKTEAYFKVNEVYAGDSAELTETIENAKAIPLPMVKMKLQLSRKLLFSEKDNSSVSDFFNRTDIYNIGPGQRVKRTIHFTCPERGYFDFNNVDVIGSDLFFTREFLKSVRTSSYLYVYPKPYDPKIMDPILNRISGEVLTKNNIIEDPFEYKGIREYQTYDSLKNVNWKAFAKSEELMVNMHDHTARRTVRVFINFENPAVLKHDDLMELCISMGISTVTHFCKAGIPVSVYANSSDILTKAPILIEEGSGDSHILAINRAFSRINLDEKALDCRNGINMILNDGEEDTYTIFISPFAKKSFCDLLLMVKNSGRDFCFICPSYEKPAEEDIKDIEDRFVFIEAKEALYEVSVS